MKYIVLIEAEEHGPISPDVLIEWVGNGRVQPKTQVRNSMINKWREAKDYDFLADAFLKQKTAFEQNKPEKDGNNSGYLKKSGLRTAKEGENVGKEEVLTAFKNPFLPDPAPVSLRILAALFDYILIGGVITCFFVIGFFFTGISFDLTLNPALYLFCFIFFIFLLTYYTVCLGKFAQTFGMWFWGILIVRKGDDAGPVYLGRAFLYTALMLIFGILSPFFIYVSGGKRALHDIFSGTQVVRISARLK
jgi:uncharacterized RDD family membrane protein YckC